MKSLVATLVFALLTGSGYASPQPLNACYDEWAVAEAVPGTVTTVTSVSSVMEENMIGQLVMVYRATAKDPDGNTVEIAFVPFPWGMEINDAFANGDLVAVRKVVGGYALMACANTSKGIHITRMSLSSPTPKDAFYRVSAEAGI